MNRRTPLISLLLIAAYLVCASAPCPPRADAGPGAGVAVTHLGGEDLSAADSEAGTTLSAFCHCGCGPRPSALGARVGVALAVEAAELVDPAAPPETVVAFDLQRAPTAPVRAIDHVPLAA